MLAGRAALADDDGFYQGDPPSTLTNRYALAIGISKYSRLESLTNPANDARAVLKVLSNYGFHTDELTNEDDPETAAIRA